MSGLWGRRRLKYVCRRWAEYGANIPSDAYVDEGLRFLRTTDITDDGLLRPEGEASVYVDATAAGDAVLEDGDLLVSRSGTIGRSLHYRAAIHGPCAFAGYLVRFRPRSTVEPRFLFYWTKSQPFADQIAAESIQTTIQNFNGQKYAGMEVPLPEDRSQQRAIADFLDRKTAAVDALIEKKERLIVLLQEKRQALITQAVTKGLDPNVPMKDSGIEWLGEIPAHWNASRLGFATTRIGDGLHGTPKYADDSPYPFVNGTNLRNGRIVVTESTRYVDPTAFRSLQLPLDQSTVLISINGTIGNLALYNNEPVALGKSAGYINCGPHLNRDFLYYYLQSAPVLRHFKQGLASTTISNLSLATLRHCPIPLPTLTEQVQLVTALRVRVDRLDRTSATVRQSTYMMREYRQALITAAVTGKLTVEEPAQ